MASLAETVMRGLQTQREMAHASGNTKRLEYLNAEIEKLKAQIADADLHERDLNLRRDMGISE